MNPQEWVGREFQYMQSGGLRVRVESAHDSHIVYRGWIIRYSWNWYGQFHYASCTAVEFRRDFVPVEGAW